MKRFVQRVTTDSEDKLGTVVDYLADHMRQLGYAPIAGTEDISGEAPDYMVIIYGERHNDAESIRYIMGDGGVEWLT